jgi:hypothetical protein
VDEISHTPLSSSWGFIAIPEDQLEPIQSKWHQLESTPGVHIGSKIYNLYQAVVNESYIPWLSSNKFGFEKIDPKKPLHVEGCLKGILTAKWDADARYVSDAIKAIVGRPYPGLELCYLISASALQELEIEWAVLNHNLVAAPFLCGTPLTFLSSLTIGFESISSNILYLLS